MQNCKKLIEVAMPIKEISAESVRDKSIRHGHISTLHLWWARRPLPVCRAVVFASLVPDPLDENCPKAFKDAVDILLGKENNAGDPYKPYDDIPYTAAIDKMNDNQRNRLLMFIGKFSERYIQYERQGKKTEAKDQLSDASLIKWDNKNNEDIISKARKLIWVAYNSTNGLNVNTLLKEFDKHYKSIKDAETELYNTIDRHIRSVNIISKESKLKREIDSFLNKMPRVFDPFAGGGAITLEAARLGCKSFGNDINPVAHIVQKGSAEFPQKFGKPIKYSVNEFKSLYGVDEYKKVKNENKIYNNGEVVAISIPNRLSFDVEFYAKILLSKVEIEIGHYYPKNLNGRRPIAYYWIYFAKCTNPSCKAHVPLMREFYLCDKKDKRVYLNPIVDENKKEISFEIKNGTHNIEDWIQRKNLICPFCKNITHISELKQQFNNNEPIPHLVAVIEEGNDTKNYRLPTDDEKEVLGSIKEIVNFPTERLPEGNNRDLHCMGWGVETWGDLFSKRPMLFINTIIANFTNLKERLDRNDYNTAILTYLAILIDRIAVANTSFGGWHKGRETLERIMGRQAIPMVFDFPESVPFCESSGSALNQLEWITRYIDSESNQPFESVLNNSSSGEKEQFQAKEIFAVVTDPPYYDAIAYADLSDFFYVWMKRTLTDLYPFNFGTPLTPKTDECTALKHHHNDSEMEARNHFENKLLEIFKALEHQTSDIVSIMFAHQSTDAWTTLCNSILGAKMNITGSWALDTEYSFTGLKQGKSFLFSSVTVAAKPTIKFGQGDYKKVKNAVQTTVGLKVNELYQLGFRGADLLTACFGCAVSEFGQYERVEKADGNEVTVAELLDMAKESAFNALLKGFDGDDFTKFYIGWLQLYGFIESDFDDAAKFSRVGLTINVSDLFTHNIFIKKGNTQELAGYKDRLIANRKIGDGSQSFIIDNVHKAMALYSGTNRNALLEYIVKVAISPESSFWRVITSLCEVLPQGSDDFKQATGLLLNKDSLIRESKNIQQSTGEQGQLF